MILNLCMWIHVSTVYYIWELSIYENLWILLLVHESSTSNRVLSGINVCVSVEPVYASDGWRFSQCYFVFFNIIIVLCSLWRMRACSGNHLFTLYIYEKCFALCVFKQYWLYMHVRLASLMGLKQFQYIRIK